MTTQTTWWGMMAGNDHIADAFFASASVLAMDYLADKDEGDLSDLVGASREKVQGRFEQHLLRHPEPHIKDMGYHAGNIYRFLTELGVGDVVVFRTLIPEETRGTVHLVRVVGEYSYHPKARNGFVHQRATQPIATVAGNLLSDGAFAEINARHTVWRLGNEAVTEIRQIIDAMK